MRKLTAMLLVLLVAAFVSGAALAEDAKATAKTLTVEGKVLCAKCTLHEEGRDKCQNVLVVDQGGKEMTYYLARNDVYDKFGEVCKGTKRVRVSGEVKEQDGHTWIVAKSISPVEEKG